MQSPLQTEGMHFFSYKIMKKIWFFLLQIFPSVTIFLIRIILFKILVFLLFDEEYISELPDQTHS